MSRRNRESAFQQDKSRFRIAASPRPECGSGEQCPGDESLRPRAADRRPPQDRHSGAAEGGTRNLLFDFANVKQPAIYILTNGPNGVLYIGVTSDLVKRIWQHRNDVVEGFSQRYHLHKLCTSSGASP